MLEPISVVTGQKAGTHPAVFTNPMKDTHTQTHFHSGLIMSRHILPTKMSSLQTEQSEESFNYGTVFRPWEAHSPSGGAVSLSVDNLQLRKDVPEYEINPCAFNLLLRQAMGCDRWRCFNAAGTGNDRKCSSMSSSSPRLHFLPKGPQIQSKWIFSLAHAFKILHWV